MQARHFSTSTLIRGIVPMLVALSWLQTGCAKEPPTAAQAYKVGLVYTAPHEAINQIINGFKQGLSAELPGQKIDIIERHANGDAAQFSSAVNGALANGPDVLVTITTPVSQIGLKNKPSGMPMVFLAITDPVGAGLADSLERPGKATGVSDLAPYKAILQFARQVLPAAKTIGLPFSPEEQPAVFGRDQLVDLAPAQGFTVVARPVTSQDELNSVVTTLAGSTDALLIGSDNGMFEAAPLIVASALRVKRPVFAGDSTSIMAGALGGYTIHYPDVGREGAGLVARIRRGEPAGTIPVVVLRQGVLELNRSSAAALGIPFPAELLARAQKVYP